MSTGDHIIPPPPWFDETPPPPATTHDELLLPVSSFDETPPLKTAQAPETPTTPSVAKRWRSGTLHLENPVSKRWRSDTLHPETPVPTACLASISKTPRQTDPSERVKRPRLVPSQIMSAALEKGCDWSLGFDGRGRVFDEINEDWRHSIFPTGRAARKEVYFASESPENQRLLLAAMARERNKWEEHKATLPLTQGEFRRWVLTPKEPDFKARLVVQGCQEDPSMMRPTGSRDSFFLVHSCAAQEHWSCGSADAASPYLQAGRIERLLLLMMPKHQPPPGCEPGEVRVARGNICGTRDAGRSWYQHFRDRLANKFRVKDSTSMSSIVGSPLSRSPMLMDEDTKDVAV